MTNKTIINNWTGGGTLQTWPDGEWQILYAKDSAGNCVTLSLASQDAIRLAYAVSPIPSEQFDRMRAANEAVYELSYPETRAEELREVANEIDCGGGCEGCSPQKIERGEFCGFVSAENLRKLASTLDLKSALSHQPAAAEINAAINADNIVAGNPSDRTADCDKQEPIPAGYGEYTPITVGGSTSDRTADVTGLQPFSWRQVNAYEACNGTIWRTAKEARAESKRAIDAFTVGRR